MKYNYFVVLFLFLFTIIFCKPIFRNGKKTHNKLLVISFDGFRWNYDQDVDTPLLDYLAEIGVKAKHMTPPFVTMTSPSHFTTITGKYKILAIITIKHNYKKYLCVGRWLGTICCVYKAHLLHLPSDVEE